MPSPRSITAMALLLYMTIDLTSGMHGHAHEGTHKEPELTNSQGTGIEEKIGGKISRDAVFYDEKGQRTTLGELIDKPTLVLPVYFTCQSSCGIMMGNLARAINDLPLHLGTDYNIIALSFDSIDSPLTARKAADNYLPILKNPPPPGSWRFLTGKSPEIMKFTGSTGFSFRKAEDGTFVHPNVLISVSHDGTIIRYLGGPNFLPFDVAMALTEAERGTPSISIRKMLSYCFSYESEKKTYTLRGVKIISGVLILIMGSFLFFILRKKNNR